MNKGLHKIKQVSYIQEEKKTEDKENINNKKNMLQFF